MSQNAGGECIGTGTDWLTQGGHGCLMVQRPGDHHAVWHFWSGEHRDFEHWYINLQTDFVRTANGYDTQDLELDIIVDLAGRWSLKDQDVLVDRIREGRYTSTFVEWIESLGRSLTSELDEHGPWWDAKWSRWQPEGAWTNTSLPAGWAASAAGETNG